MAGVALIGSEYLSEVIFATDPPPLMKAGIGMAAIASFYSVNLLGLRMSSKTQNVLMIIKIDDYAAHQFYLVNHPPEAVAVVSAHTWSGLRKILWRSPGRVSFTYGGYQQTINFGGEVHNSTRTIPRGISIGILIIIVLYLAVSYAYYHAIGFDQLKTSKGIAAW